MVLAFKLVVTPAVVTLSTLAGRRYGRIASGWLIGLPLTSGPIAAFFAVEHGHLFAARAAVGSLGGAIGEVCFCTVFAVTARRRGWRASVAAASVAFAAAALVLHELPLEPKAAIVVPLALAACAALVLGLRLIPHVPSRSGEAALPSSLDLPFRAGVATVFLLALTGAATLLGPQLAGVLAVYPLYTVVLAAFAHRHEGEPGSVQVLRGLIVGLYSFVCFYLVLPLALMHFSTVAAFALAFAAALAVQAASLLALVRVSVPGTLPGTLTSES